MFGIVENAVDRQPARAHQRERRVVVRGDDAIDGGPRRQRTRPLEDRACPSRAAMQRLPEEQRLAVSLVLIEGLSYQEAADVVGSPGRHADEPPVARARGARRDCSAWQGVRPHERAILFGTSARIHAYVDGALDAGNSCARLEADSRDDIRRSPRASRSNASSRARLRAEFDPVLSEPIRQRRPPLRVPSAAVPLRRSEPALGLRGRGGRRASGWPSPPRWPSASSSACWRLAAPAALRCGRKRAGSSRPAI